MKRIVLFTVTSSLLMLTACNSASTTGEAAKKNLTSERDKFSYAIGTDIGMSLEPFQEEIDLSVVFQGIRDNVEGKPALLEAPEAKEVKDVVFKRLAEVQQEKQKQAAEDNKSAGEAFLAENGKKEGVITTESGLQYEVLTMGEGEKPAASDNVEVHYRGTTIDGTEFDSSEKQGKPVTFRVDRVIKGWTEALQLMPVGSKFKLVIPAELAYGERGAGGAIGPNETLIFDVELLSIKDSVSAQ